MKVRDIRCADCGWLLACEPEGVFWLYETHCHGCGGESKHLTAGEYHEGLPLQSLFRYGDGDWRERHGATGSVWPGKFARVKVNPPPPKTKCGEFIGFLLRVAGF